ncbi:MAG: rod shape-determining protein [Deltaproteobacteria bacterium RIFOXYA12_FULL_58_15]|nr:MAG: rod shape-determining protein [Deltaproteobacteria bacterium RIFOXYA12_FULL_58_15]OGR14854.1 MAG: rod shape-determining protein [Deltaproteobacteria bacterium RIFOXYB12_FULL_58_9]
MFDSFFGLFSTDLAIDLGTANTLVYVRNKGVVMNEPSVVAITRVGGTQRVLAVGAEAKNMLGKTPGNIVAIRPMRDGVIADFTVTEAMLKYFITKIHNRRHFVRSRLIISVPAGITNVERKAVREAAENSGVREVWIIEQPMAAAIGAGLPVREARGNMIVDIGGGTTDVAVVSMSGMVTNVTLKVAGDKMDDAIINYVRRHHNMMIGERTAEQIKIRLGSVWPPDDNEPAPMDMKGRDLITGVPKSIELTGPEVREALGDCARSILEAVKATLEKTPPELAGDISERGIVLAGGGAYLRGLDTMLREEIGIPVFMADEPLLSVVKGAGMVLEDLDGYKSLLLEG